MGDYQAEPGREDRHGEMTGAISINMVLCMPPVGVWCIFIGPLLFDALWPTLLIGLVAACLLPIAMMPLSRLLWVRFSQWADRGD